MQKHLYSAAAIENSYTSNLFRFKLSKWQQGKGRLNMRKFETKFIPLLALLAISLSGVVVTAKANEKETFSAIFMQRTSSGITMIVEHWTTIEEMQKLLKAFNEGGSDGLLKEMRKMRAGRTSGGGMTSAPRDTTHRLLNFASSQQTEKGRLIRLVSDRPFSFVESEPLTQPQEYEFGVIELILPEKGEGQGTLIPTAKISINRDGNIEFKTLGTEHQKLIGVTKSK